MLCRMYQFAIERQLDDSGTVCQKKLLRHIEKCSRCRRYHQQLMQLDGQLASNMWDDLSESDYLRIEAAIRQQLSDTSINRIQMQGSRPLRPARWRPVIQSIAAVIVIGAMAGWMMLTAGRRAHNTEMLAQLSQDGRKLQTQTAMLLALPERSMQNELDQLVNDAKRAAAFIRDCTPANPAGQTVQDGSTLQPQSN